jgi:hypothetical protein
MASSGSPARYAIVLAELLPCQRELTEAGSREGLRKSLWASAMAGAAGTLIFGTDLRSVRDGGRLLVGAAGEAPTQAMLDDI